MKSLLPLVTGLLVLSVAVSSCSTVRLVSSSDAQLPGQALAWDWTASDCAALAAAIKACDDYSQTSIEAIYGAYLKLDRRSASGAELTEIKFALMQWQHRGKTYLLSLLKNEAADSLDISRRLAALHVTISPEENRILAAAGLDTGRNTRPAEVPFIKPSRDSDWGWQRILATKTLADYPRDEQGRVVYAGCTFVPGDVLLVNLANPSEGVFTAFTNEENYAYHAAMYLEIEKDGLRFPCVYESFEHGTRIVPLATYLSPSHSLFVEVLRWQDLTPNAALLGKMVLEELGKEHGFNLSMEDGDISRIRSYVTCTTTFTPFLAAAGCPLPASRTPIAPGALPNMQAAGIKVGEFLTPRDFMLMRELAPAGIVSNDRLGLYASSTMAISQVRTAFSSGLWNPEKEPDFQLYLDAVGSVRNKTFLVGPLLLWIFGFNDITFPDGPKAALAAILCLEEIVDKAVEDLEKVLAASPEILDQPALFSIHALGAEPRIAGMLDKGLTKVKAWFKPR